MISMQTMIVFIAPYPKLKNLADGLVGEFRVPIRTCIGDLRQGLEIARNEIKNDVILVSRGGTAKLIRETLGAQVIEVGVSFFDLLSLLHPFAEENRKIAVVGFESLTVPAQKICGTLHIPACILPVQSEVEVPGRIEEAKALGVDCVIGDMVSATTAEKSGLAFRLIESSVDAVRDALNKAAAIVTNLNLRRENAGRIKVILNTVKEGIISVDAEGKVTQINPTAEELLHRPGGTAIEEAIDKVVPGLDVTRVIREKKESYGQVLGVAGGKIVFNTVPIVVNGKAEGAVSVLQEVRTIQNIEKKVRRQLHEKGLFAKYRFEDFLTVSENMRKCLAVARQYAGTTSNIVIYGETGTGKELLAQSIHNESPSADGPFVAINCGALPPNLLESELFGYTEGAFTGASRGGKIGLFELAHNGTIFLDEINEMNVHLQKKLLRVLQEREIMRIGDDRVVPISVRVVTASNVPLEGEMVRGRIRKDLFYRLNVLDIRIPPLRERRDDIIPLFEHFVFVFASRNSLEGDGGISSEFRKDLLAYEWPGNVRELENVAEKFVILRKLFAADYVERFITSSLNGPPSCSDDSYVEGSLRDIERRIVARVVESEGGNLSRAAKRLGIDRNTLKKKIVRD